ncbi:hypothetical protein QQP08_006462 [Theobroma cacao]|nr:hypothetical protein QQP08_006462 [Theobroma cacao]
MSFVTDSPVHSSCSDDFAALLDAELEVGSSGFSPDEEDEEADGDNDNDDDLDSQKEQKVQDREVGRLRRTLGSNLSGFDRNNLEEECSKSLSQLKSDEREPDGALASILKLLRQIHHMFFDELDCNLARRDVKQLLTTVRKEVLRGCKIIFSRAFPTDFRTDTHPLWKMAERLGATWSTETELSVTHVVSKDAGTEKSHWAVKEKKFFVHPWWIEVANFSWHKQPEQNFPVSQGRKQ